MSSKKIIFVAGIKAYNNLPGTFKMCKNIIFWRGRATHMWMVGIEYEGRKEI